MKVEYTHRFDFRYDPHDGQRYPILPFLLSRLQEPANQVEVDTYLDSGCSKSLFDGRLARILGIDLTAGQTQLYTSATGVTLSATICPIRLQHPALGSFELEVGFAQILLKRNLLGRDFLAQVQFGLREHRLEFYLRHEP